MKKRSLFTRRWDSSPGLSIETTTSGLNENLDKKFLLLFIIYSNRSQIHIYKIFILIVISVLI